MKRYAFTLIELLVVIAIIAILAAILFPVFAQAKEQAKKTTALSQAKEIGLALNMYLNDADDTFMPAYTYRNPCGTNNNCAAPTNLDATGINHWSGVILPYVKSEKMFVSPMDPTGGLAPTNFNTASNNEGYGVNNGAISFTNAAVYGANPNGGVDGTQDTQAHRISYTVNEAIMPRPRGYIGGVQIGQAQNVVAATSMNSPAGTIAITDFSNYADAVNGTGPGGTTNKSHRPTDAYAIDANGTLAYDVSNQITGSIFAMSPAAAKAIFALQPTYNATTHPGGTVPHIVYANSGRYSSKTQDVFIFADSHAKAMAFENTLKCDNFMWGDKAYNQGGKDVLCAATGNPVQVGN
ncbi:MAG: prepilin-type N-terminal cleavage/methylation domain-containing protein [Armatimonadetes bacterium]|nr:prepilin-type N-terminal cleavage/methylation domain-containing protein [Armatimonadota bacterium]